MKSKHTAVKLPDAPAEGTEYQVACYEQRITVPSSGSKGGIKVAETSVYGPSSVNMTSIAAVQPPKLPLLCSHSSDMGTLSGTSVFGKNCIYCLNECKKPSRSNTEVI